MKGFENIEIRIYRIKESPTYPSPCNWGKKMGKIDIWHQHHDWLCTKQTSCFKKARILQISTSCEHSLRAGLSPGKNWQCHWYLNESVSSLLQSRPAITTWTLLRAGSLYPPEDPGAWTCSHCRFPIPLVRKVQMQQSNRLKNSQGKCCRGDEQHGAILCHWSSPACQTGPPQDRLDHFVGQILLVSHRLPTHSLMHFHSFDEGFQRVEATFFS